MTNASTNAFGTGVLLSLANPYGVAFWLGVGGAIVGTGVLHPQPIHFAVFFAGFMLAALCWCFVFAALIAGARQLVLFGFGLRLLAGTLSLLI